MTASNICHAGPRFGFAKEARVPMRDDGVAPDLHAGDGVYVAVIDTASARPGSMVRWRAEAAVAPPSDAPRTSSKPSPATFLRAPPYDDSK